MNAVEVLIRRTVTRGSGAQIFTGRCRRTLDGLAVMTWFPVDDSFHSHPKATAASLAAIGLWTVAGSWSNDHLTDGFVPDHQIPSLSRGQVELAKELVAAGLWRRARGGYQFHQWDADGSGSPRNVTRQEAIAKRSKMSSGGTLGNHRRWHVDKGKTDPKCAFCQGKQDRPPNRVPDRGGESGGDSGASPPSPSPSPSVSSSRSSSLTVRNARGPDDDDDRDHKIEQRIIELLADLTGRTITPDWAATVRRHLLDGRDVAKPITYVTKAIRERPRDFLPAAGPAPPVDPLPGQPDLPPPGHRDNPANGPGLAAARAALNRPREES